MADIMVDENVLRFMAGTKSEARANPTRFSKRRQNALPHSPAG
jgi:hypothetical protein